MHAVPPQAGLTYPCRRLATGDHSGPKLPACWRMPEGPAACGQARASACPWSARASRAASPVTAIPAIAGAEVRKCGSPMPTGTYCGGAVRKVVRKCGSAGGRSVRNDAPPSTVRPCPDQRRPRGATFARPGGSRCGHQQLAGRLVDKSASGGPLSIGAAYRAGLGSPEFSKRRGLLSTGATGIESPASVVVRKDPPSSPVQPRAALRLSLWGRLHYRGRAKEHPPQPPTRGRPAPRQAAAVSPRCRRGSKTG